MLSKFADLCHPNPCNNSGVCSTAIFGGYTCDCSATGYTGGNCETGTVLWTTHNL